MSGLVKGVETWLVPVKLQQLYKGYSLSEVTLADIVMPHTFLASLARLADVIYKTGTVRSHSTPGSKQDKDLQAALRSQSGNYGFLRRFDAATGMAFETKGPFGAVVATCVLPGQDNDVPLTGHVHPFQPRYRIYVVFRGTSPGKLYWDDISTDLKAASLNLDNPLGSKSGTLARLPQHLHVVPPRCREVRQRGRHLPPGRVPQVCRGVRQPLRPRHVWPQGQAPA